MDVLLMNVVRVHRESVENESGGFGKQELGQHPLAEAPIVALGKGGGGMVDR